MCTQQPEMQNIRSIVLIRGLPGSGKSTLATVLAEGKYPIFSVDDYFTDEKGHYHFEYDKNHLAYRQCQESVLASIAEGVKKIFIANTFTMDWEMKPYFAMAKNSGYQIFVVTVEKYHEGKNIHQIPDDQIDRMVGKYKLKLK